MPKLSMDQKEALEAQIRKLVSSQSGRHTKVLLATGGAFAGSSWLTTLGIFEKTIEAGVSTPEGMITAAMSSTIAATSLGAGTMILFSVAMNAAREQRWAVLGLAGTLIPFTAGISTINAVNANAGPPSLVYNMRDSAKAYAEYYEGMTLDASGALSAQAALLPLEASICERAEGERTSGVLTGSPGKGAVYAAYASGCTNIKKINVTLGETVQRTDMRRGEASAILNALATIPDDTGASVFERRAEFRAMTGELRTLIEESGSENLAERLNAQLEILHASVVTLDVKGGSFGSRQAGAVANLKHSLGLVSGIVRDFLDAPESAQPQPPAELLDMSAAVAKYWKRNIPQIGLAIMIDVMPLWFLALLKVSQGTINARRKELGE